MHAKCLLYDAVSDNDICTGADGFIHNTIQYFIVPGYLADSFVWMAAVLFISVQRSAYVLNVT
jgi:hypothetical protein